MSCPPDDVLVLALVRRGWSGESKHLAEHLAGCERCQQVLAIANGSASSAGPVVATDAAMREGAVVGRYIVLGLVGRGSMGRVYAAYDPQLDRKVALKLLHTGRRDGVDDPKVQRLLREARAMAKLSHPNVVTVHDIGLHEGEPFVAMEFVEGITLTQWLAGEPRRLEAILEVFAAAGRGLAAAHRLGIVHRDFKPDNVLVGSEGRVLVGDFGLARWTTSHRTDEPPPAVGRLVARSMQTRTGALVGTPAYMSPEQLRGGAADARSDQFSFCVALWEALTGHRPFGGRTIDACLRAMETTQPNAPHRPRWLTAVLLRGLRVTPGERYPSMDELLAALDRRSRQVAMRAGLVVVSLAAVVPLMVGMPALLHSPGVGYCDAVHDRIDDVWNEGRRTALVAAMEGAEPHAEMTARTVEVAIDRYAARWSSSMGTQCADEARARAPNSVLALRAACLQRRLVELDVLTTEIIGAEGATADRALMAVENLVDPGVCLTDAGLAEAAGFGEPTHTDEAVAPVVELVAQSTARARLGQLDTAERTAYLAHQRAVELGHRALIAEAGLSMARIRQTRGDSPHAEALLEQAIVDAVASRQHRTAAMALMLRAFLVGYERGEYERALDLLALAEAEIEALGSSPWLEADLDQTRASLHMRQGDYAMAADHYERAIEARSRAELPGERRRGEDALNLGGARLGMLQFDSARQAFELAIELLAPTHGPRHPLVLMAKGNLLSIDLGTHVTASTLDRAREAIDDAVAGLGASHPTVGHLRGKYARALRSMERPEEARREVEAAIEILRSRAAVAPIELAQEQSFLAVLLYESGEPEAALPWIRAAVDAASRPTTNAAALCEFSTAEARIELEAGRPGEALKIAASAAELARQVWGASSARLGAALEVKARALAALDRANEARAVYAEVLSVDERALERGELQPIDVALAAGRFARFLQARFAGDPEIPVLVRRVEAVANGASPRVPGELQALLTELTSPSR